MGAICGFFYCDGRPVITSMGAAMMEGLAVFPADADGVWRGKEVFLGCRAQHFTSEATKERLPFFEEPTGLAITADAIIDNREELFDLLEVDHIQRQNIPDSILILRAFKKWGAECPRFLLGDYAFAIYDKAKRSLFCAVDHAGTRTLYYYRSERLLAFSTLLKPLFALPEIDRRLNDTWIADFLAIPSVMHQLDGELTLYKDVCLLPAGHSLTVTPDGIVKECYWRLRRQSELRLKSNAEYEEAFREVLGTAVRCRLRNTRQAGVMMSGGLDSTAVACMAARELAQSGRRLQIFSAVPMMGYRDWLPVNQAADESPFIEAVREHAGNIDLNYCRADGKHPLSDTDRFIRVIEQPFKIFSNLFWFDDIMATAVGKNVGVLMHGSAGNMTISWGYLDPFLRELFWTGRWYKLVREARAEARLYPRPWRALFRTVMRLLPFNIYYRMQRSDSLDEKRWSPINPEFALANREDERLARFEYTFSPPAKRSWELREFQFRADYFSHLSPITTKLSLAYRLMLRDATVDRRLMEFCHSVPEDQYFSSGNDRYLLRRAMRGLLPDKVRRNIIHGRQSADWGQRLQPGWRELAAEIYAIGCRDYERRYLDVPRIHQVLKDYQTIDDRAPDDPNVAMLIRSLIFCRFLRSATGDGY